MNYYFISDDMFFLEGLKHALCNVSQNKFFINVHHYNELTPTKWDVVIIAVHNHEKRKRLFKQAFMRYMKIIVLLAQPVVHSETMRYPAIISKKIAIDELQHLLNKSANARIVQDVTSMRELDLINSLCRGMTITTYASRHRIPTEYLYRLKRKLFCNFGLINCNSTGVFVCRDLLSIRSWFTQL